MKIAVVIVTFNRLETLKGTLRAYAGQTTPPDLMIVVDNHSTDGTAEYLAQWKSEKGPFERQIYILPENQGGSGGFAFGMTQALNTDCDWVFVADDDAVPRRDVFEQLQGFCIAHPDLAAQAVAVCTAVFNRDHHSSFHRAVLKKTPVGCLELYVPESQYALPYFEFNMYSFVGTMMRTQALRQAGVARADFFIYNDDFEHALRLQRYGKIYCVPPAVMDHVDNLTRCREASWRDYYGTRNAVMFHKIHFGNYAAFWRAVRRLVMELPSRNPEKLRLIWQGIVDGFQLKTGLHPVYRPGWKPRRILH